MVLYFHDDYMKAGDVVNFKQEMTQSVNTKLLHNQIMTVNLLAMNNCELDAFLNEAYESNPLLDYGRVPEREVFQGMSERASGDDGSFLEQMEDQSVLPSEDRNMWVSNIMMQLSRNEHSEKKWNLMMKMVNFLSDEGYLAVGLAEIAEILNETESEVRACHKILSRLKPEGVFSLSVSDFLILQLTQMGKAEEKLIRLLKEHAEDLVRGNRAKAAKELKISREKLSEYIRILSSLKSAPITSDQTEVCQYVIPDIIIKKGVEGPQILINDGWMGEFRYNDYYLQMMEETKDLALKEYLQEKYAKSRFLFDSIEMRRATIVRIMEEIVRLQEAFFFRKGTLAPMSMEKIAEETDMNTSTVSRALREKVIEYSYGSIKAKDLFTGSIMNDEGKELSKRSVMDQILEMIQKEDKNAPLSDAQIEAELKKGGIEISRRTVSKYRKEAGILDSYNRKYEGGA